MLVGEEPVGNNFYESGDGDLFLGVNVPSLDHNEKLSNMASDSGTNATVEL